MSIIKFEKLRIEDIHNVISESAFTAEIDDDKDIYVNGSQIEFPCWVQFSHENFYIKIFTFINFDEKVKRPEAYEFINNLNRSIVFPRFWLVENDDEDNFKLHSDYFIDVENSLDTTYLLKSLNRFSSAFNYSLSFDKDGYYFCYE
tara:strand:- start:55 stop:492 length:438 start_codon:yes stop_codon:yes gene_type:complete